MRKIFSLNSGSLKSKILKKYSKNCIKKYIFLSFFAVFFSSNLFALSQNKVVKKIFLWQIKGLPHFDLYYYDNAGKNLLPYTSQYLENAYCRVNEILSITLKEKLPFFLYNSHNEFEQTNITDIGEGTGGVTEAFKNRFLAAHLGSHRYLEYVITHECTHEFEYEYLFNGGWKSAKLLKFIFYPNWLMEGLAEYSYGEMDSTTREMYLRDAALSSNLLPIEQLHNFNHVLPHQITLAYKESEAFIHYLVEEYGQDKLPLMLKSFQDKFDANSVLKDVLGTDVYKLDKRFREYMEDKYKILSSSMAEPSFYGQVITDKERYPYFAQSAVFSPDGSSIAYIADQTGTKEIYLMNINSRVVKDLLNLDKTIKVEDVHTDGKALSFSSDGKFLCFCGERIQKDFIYLYNFSGSTLQEINTFTDTAASPVFSNDGKIIYFSGMKDGFKNIYELNYYENKLSQLTTGYADKTDIAISPDGNYLVFSAERKNSKGRMEYDLCRLNLTNGTEEFITSFPGDERYPCFSKEGLKIYFTSDMDGVNDIYSLTLSDNKIERLTKVVGGNFQPEFSPDGKKLIFSSFREGERRLYITALDSIMPQPVNCPEDAVVKSSSSLIVSNINFSSYPEKNINFRVSTDLFFPALFYSSYDGLFIAAYWQASDFMGNHVLQSIVSYASGIEYFDYNFSYGFLKYRPQFYLNCTGKEYFYDIDETIKIQENSQTLTALYPLNRFQSVQFMFATIDRSEKWIKETYQNWRKRENAAGIAFLHDTVRGPYLESTRGTMLSLSSQFSDKAFSGDYTYQQYFAEFLKYFPLGKEHTIGCRSFAGASFGEDAGTFRLGGVDRVRAIPVDGEIYAGRRIFFTNLEWRFPIVKNINYHMWYMFPDFFFKTFYGSLFIDAGVVWNEDSQLKHLTLDYWKSSYGIGLRFHTFILQMYPLLLNFQYAYRMDTSAPAFYFIAGTNF